MKHIYTLFISILVLFSYQAVAQNVGIGTTNPSQKLEVSGWIELGNETEGVTGTAGAIRYHTSGKIQYHDGTAWRDIYSSSNPQAGDNLGNHIATTNLNMNDKQVQNIYALQGKDWDDNTGGTNNKYRVLFRDGAHMFYNGGVAIGPYSDNTWSDLPDGQLVVQNRIGIGVTPATTLHVNGSVRFQGLGSTSGNTTILTVDASGNVTKRPAGSWTGGADNLGNHTATTTLDMTNHEVDNVTYLDVTPGDGYGVRFWSSNSYAIGMGNAGEYHYGPVTSYSIKNNMSSDAGRGWTWGIDGATPVAGISNTGYMQMAGDLTVAGGDIYINDGNTRLTEAGGNALRMQTNSGYIDMGAQNTSWAHMSTDRPSFWFNTRVTLSNGQLSSYSSSHLYLMTNGSTRLFANYSSGNVGIGTTSPSQKLDVAGNVTASRYYDRNNTAYYVDPASTSIVNEIGWGLNATRTQTRDNAGSMGTKSGFYETSSATSAENYPIGSTGWWHLLDVRHQNPANNFAMQIAGSFYDQKIYYRKTINDAAAAWSEFYTTANPPAGDNLGNHLATTNLNMNNREVDNINYLDMRAGNGYALRFWSSNSYSISMGNASTYKYGPVTDYSIKNNMSSTANRGWTWGVYGSTPVAAISNTGYMQIAGDLTVSGKDINMVAGNASRIHRLGEISFDWTGGSYDNPQYHGIQSKNESGSWADVIRINSYHDIINTLDANNNNSTSYFKIQEHSSTNGTDLFWVRSSDGYAYNKGRLGIGTTGPTQMLDVAGNVTASRYYDRNNTGYYVDPASSTAAYLAGRIAIDGKTVIDDGAGWHRSHGTTGWYNDTYGGGIYMTDATWIRTYGNKSFYHNTGTMRTDGTFQVGSSGSRFIVKTDGKVGVNTTSPSYTFHAYSSSSLGNSSVITGQSNGASGVGVQGTITNSSNGWAGVEGNTEADSYGVKGLHLPTSGGGYGVYGVTNSLSIGWGGYFVGDVYCSGWYSGSDERFKKNIETLKEDNVLDKLLQVEPMKYEYNAEKYPGMGFKAGETNFGFIAQDLEKLFPEMVTNKKSIANPTETPGALQAADNVDGYYMVDYVSMVPILVQGIKEQQKIIDDLRQRVDDLENK